MFNQYNPILDLDRRIEDLQRLKENYQKVPQQQPINIYNNSNASQNDFKAQILSENEKVDEILVNTKTMFFEPKNGKLYIKEINGDIQSWDVILPKDEKDLKIEELERKIKEYESTNANANTKKSKSSKDDNGEYDTTTETNC